MANTTRTYRARALEKLQKILDRGWRNNTQGMDHFFWENQIAVWRNPYDLGATKEGSLLLRLGEKNNIASIHCDDAGPAWDLTDENSAHWQSINNAATDLAKPGARATLRAQDIVHNISVWNNHACQSKAVIRERVMGEWHATPGLAPVMAALFPEGQSQDVWHFWAHYLSEALKLSHSTPEMLFEHQGVTLNTKHFLPYMVAMSAKQYERPPSATVETQSLYFANARLQYSRKNDNQEQWDWKIHLPTPQGNDLFSNHCHARIMWEEERGPFMNVLPGRNFRQLHESELVGYTTTVHAMLTGYEPALTFEEACISDCKKLLQLENSYWDSQCSPKHRVEALRTIAHDWWGDNPAGQELIRVLDSLYAWKNLCTTNPGEAWTNLIEMARVKVQHMDRTPTFTVEGDLFQEQLAP